MTPDQYTHDLLAPDAALRAYARRVLAERGRSGPDWPSWCYLPMSAVGTFLRSRDPALHMRVAELTMALTWRATRGIYRFDPELYREVRDTPLKGQLPSELLLRLPEWCVYIETPGMTTTESSEGVAVSPGFFAWLEAEVGGERSWPELRLWIIAQHSGGRWEGIPGVIHLRPGADLSTAIEDALDEADRQQRLHGLPPLDGSQRALMRRISTEQYQGRLGLLLYLCSERPNDTGPWPSPRPTPRPRRAHRPSPPPPVQTWPVGERIGSVLRAARAAAEGGEGTGGEGARHAPRPHIRAAHWHTYWTGQGRTTPVLRWVAPVVVGGEGHVPTVHPVRDYTSSEP